MIVPLRLGLVATFAAGTLVGVLAGAAAAADLPPLPPAPVQATPVAIGSGWYLRGDFTQSWPDHPRDGTRPDPNDPGMPPLVGLRLSPEGGYGGGIGYQINPWLRVDATIDQRTASSFRGYSSRSVFETGYNLEAGKLSVLTGLVNVYADLGTWYGFTPYVGAGIGFADKRMSRNYTQTTCLTDGCDGLDGTGPREPAFRANHSVATFAWALTAGLSYEIGAGLSLDAAYRYIDLGRAKSGVDLYGGSTRLKDLAASEFRVGLRYRFADSLLPFGATQAYGN
ncbi:outer membrane protein [Methylorubrum zatmanii]|uniref:Outer membrane protein n=1 Tax=Methylorubrum zatmanii TaxID=29429 RepID=A0ABW1WPP2_9HYPH|nr:outer membrane beta-barrel protein [Methylorubrum zatmanii]MBD8906608.1 porin [Methylorubrum zatmanii]